MNTKVKKILEYTGIIGSAISALAYIMVTVVIVWGFESALDIQKQVLFAVLGAFTGLMITFFLRGQGVIFAKKEDISKIVMKEYYEKLNKKKTIKQLHTIKYYIIMQTLLDIILKGVTMALSTYFVLYIFMEGSGDYALVFLAVSNILMFTCFGMVALSNAYDKYLDEHIPAIKEIIIKLDQARSIAQKELEHADLQQRELLVSSTTGGKESDRHPVHPELPGRIWSEGLWNGVKP
jgi:Na+/melibiose symporter-like transporter